MVKTSRSRSSRTTRGTSLSLNRNQNVQTIKPLNIKSNRLPIQYSIIVPSTRREKKISTSAFNKRVDSEKTFMSKTFGGDTTVKAQGNFLERRGKRNILIKEKNAVVESSTTRKVFNTKRKILIRHLKERNRQWKQNSILYKIEGETFIFPRQSFIPHDRSKRRIIVS